MKTGKLKTMHWQDAAIGLLGLWFAASPWVLDLRHEPAAVVTGLAMGLALVAMAAGAMLAPRTWEHWAVAAIGAGAAASPWLLGYAGDPVAWRNAVAVGLIVVLLAAWAMLRQENRCGPVLSGTGNMAH